MRSPEPQNVPSGLLKALAGPVPFGTRPTASAAYTRTSRAVGDRTGAVHQQ
jgi:hypothetical protein